MFNTKTYITRREKLVKMMTSGLVIIPGNQDAAMNYPANIYHFRQDSNFLYFFGLDLPGFIGVFDIDENTTTLFGNDVDIDDIIWMGSQPEVVDLAASVGVTRTAPLSDLGKVLSKARQNGRKIHFTPQYRGENKIMFQDLLDISASSLNQSASPELIRSCVALRSIKEDIEIEEIEKACAVDYEIHTLAMKMAKPGIYEREISGRMEGIALCYGGLLSFPPIVSQHGETLHNHDHSKILEAGKLLLVDSGAETPLHYAADHTRTMPVGGKFSSKQKEIYEIVHRANIASIEATKPDILYRDVHFIACRELIEGMKLAGLMKGDTDAAMDAGAHTLFLPHGLGHMLGLDVHDMENFGENYVGYDDEIKRSTQFGTAYLRLGRKLQSGFVLTNEPGIYFIPELIDQFKSEKKFTEFINYGKVEEYRNFGGIRLEDDILVTTDGCRNLGKPIPKTVSEVEDMMK